MSCRVLNKGVAMVARMRVLPTALLFSLLALPASAQDANGGLLRLDLSFLNRSTLKEKNASVTVHQPRPFELPRQVNLRADLSAQSGAAGPLEFRIYQILFGPQASRRFGRFTFYGHALAGAAQLRVRETPQEESFSLVLHRHPADGARASGTGPAFRLGGGIDVDLNDRVQLRAVECDTFPARYFDRWYTDTRLRFGLDLALNW